MKQIIVNVSGLSLEEKQRVNEALEKITGARKIPLISNSAGWFFAPDSSGSSTVTWDLPSTSETPTHTPNEVLEMAGMAPATEHIILADTLILTDSSGNIVYDSTPDSLNSFIKQRANGVSVKLNKNGAAVMVEKRKVRKDFDPSKEYSVDVSKCAEEEKKEVQQAFFDVGIKWAVEGKEYKRLYAAQYTNTTVCGHTDTYLMYSTDTNRCNMTAREFLALVYEPEQQGHIHAELMAQYAEDAKTSDKPWELWQFKNRVSNWVDIPCSPVWDSDVKYRRKPKTKLIHGVEVPDISFTPKDGEEFVYPNIYDENYATVGRFYSGYELSEMTLKAGCCYPYTEEGTQAAIMHAKAMLGVQS